MSEPSDHDKDREQKLLETFVNQIAEHFENVQVFVNTFRGEMDGTVMISRGAGNWFARYGQVKEWVIKSEERSKMDEREKT